MDRAFGGKNTSQVRGAMRRLPLSGTVFLLAFLAITGSPPFGPFVSEFMIIYGAFIAGHFLIGAGILSLMLVIFLGMGRIVLAAVFGRPPAAAARSHYQDGWMTGVPVLAGLVLVLLLGLYLPEPLRILLYNAGHYLGAKP